MRAVRIHTFGGADTLLYEPAPRPTPGAGEVLVRVHAAGVNPLDVKVREGWTESRAKHTLPLVLGWDVSGTVMKPGPGVTEFREGDEVFGRVDFSRDGAYAEWLVARASELAPKPEALDHLRAAAIPIAALTAWQALFEVGGLAAGRHVLIQRAAGGVGSFAVQLARWKGAFVIGTASSRNHDFVTGLGADEVIDYERVRFEEVLRDVDVVLDSLGEESQRRALDVLKPGFATAEPDTREQGAKGYARAEPGGVLISIVGPPPAEEAAKRGIRAVGMLVRPDPAQLTQIARLVLDGSIEVVVDRVLPLSEARRAHEVIESGHSRGKIVLRVI